MQDELEKIITEWLKKEFNNEKAFPKVVVSGLASEINKHAFGIYLYIKEAGEREDAQYIAKVEGGELTEEELSLVLHRYGKCEPSGLQEMREIVIEILRERESLSTPSSLSQDGTANKNNNNKKEEK